jgi:hypothetical protein
MLLKRMIPEIWRLPDARDRGQVRVQALRQLCLTGPIGLGLGLLLVIPAVALGEAVIRLLGGRSFGPGIPHLICFALLCALVQAALMFCLKGHARARIRQELRARGLPTCLQCGYDLTGNVSGACPECGACCAAEAPTDTFVDEN